MKLYFSLLALVFSFALVSIIFVHIQTPEEKVIIFYLVNSSLRIGNWALILIFLSSVEVRVLCHRGGFGGGG